MSKTVIVLFIYLFFCSLLDIKTKTIPFGMLLIGAVVAIINFSLLLFCRERTPLDFIFVLCPGVSVFLLAKLSKEMIGEADGIIFMISGLFFTLFETLMVISAAFFLSFLASCFLFIFRRVGKKTKIPFIPFIFLSTIVVGCM